MLCLGFPRLNDLDPDLPDLQITFQDSVVENEYTEFELPFFEL